MSFLKSLKSIIAGSNTRYEYYKEEEITPVVKAPEVVKPVAKVEEKETESDIKINVSDDMWDNFPFAPKEGESFTKDVEINVPGFAPKVETPAETPKVEKDPLAGLINEAAKKVAMTAREAAEDAKFAAAEAKAVVDKEEAITKKMARMAEEARVAEAKLLKAFDMLEKAEAKAEADIAKAKADKEKATADAIEANTSMAMKLAEIRAKREAKKLEKIKISEEAAGLVNIPIGEETEKEVKERSVDSLMEDYIFFNR
jgi:hypothetical protein